MVFRFMHPDKTTLIDPERALRGRDTEMPVPPSHFVLGHEVRGPYPEGLETAMFALGCFWGAERKFWQVDGVYTTAVGYAAGLTPNPTYEEVCSGRTGHTEAVLVVFDPKVVTYDDLLRVFWEAHDPTQGMRQGNDVGTQYRSAIYVASDAQQVEAEQSRAAYNARLKDAGYPPITTEIRAVPEFWYAEEYHQQYLYKQPNGYDCHAHTGIDLPPL
jgi:peptide-methionine (S)-S-oxide reductase